MSSDPYIIINPHANSGNLGKNLDKILNKTKEYLGDFSYHLTEYGRHEVELAKKAIEDGYTTIVALGGDGTATNIGDVLVGNEKIRLGLLSAGSMCDWHRTHSIPYDLESSLEIFVEGHVEKFPAIKCQGDKTLYAFDMADGGFTARAAAAAFTEMKWLKVGIIKYNYLALKYVIKTKNTPCTVTIDDRDPIYIEEMTNVFGALGDDIIGFHVLPGNPHFSRKDKDLGFLVAHGMKGFKRISMLVKAISGKHLGLRGVWFTRGKKMVVESTKEAVFWEAEGEIFNQKKHRVEIERVDNAINLIVPKERDYKIEYDESYFYEDFEESFKKRKYEKIS
ncbi:MAG: diacylglycerol/lipid kinase family protein [Candidatus Heimdallarchaeaceae archaeon]